MAAKPQSKLDDTKKDKTKKSSLHDRIKSITHEMNKKLELKKLEVQEKKIEKSKNKNKKLKIDNQQKLTSVFDYKIFKTQKLNTDVSKWINKRFDEEFYKEISKIYREDEEEFRKNSNKNGNDLLSFISESGVSKDKLYTLSVKIQENPFHRLDLFKKLLDYSFNNKPRNSIIAIELVKDLFINHLLPESEMGDFPNNAAELGAFTRENLLLRYYESELKMAFDEFVNFLNKKTRENTFEWFRAKLLKFMFEIFGAKPQGEQKLLTFLIEIFSCDSKVIASRNLFYFSNLLKDNPGMKIEVAKEIQKFVKSPKIDTKAQHLAIALLNQFKYSRHPESRNLADEIVKIYIEFFAIVQSQIASGSDPKKVKKTFAKKATKKRKKISNNIKRGETEQTTNETLKLLGLVFNGISRALPFVSQFDASLFVDKMDAMYKISHCQNFSASVQVLNLLFKIHIPSGELPERFYTALYNSLLRKDLSESSLQTMYLSIFYRSIKADRFENRVMAFLKRILRVSLQQPVNTTVSMLIMLLELSKEQKAVKKYIRKLEKTDTKDGDIDKDIDNGIKGSYCGLKRNPLHAGAENSLPLEINILKTHFHPAVSEAAKKLANLEELNYGGDPVEDFSEAGFIEKFVNLEEYRPSRKKNEANAKNKKAGVFSKKKSFKPKTTSLEHYFSCLDSKFCDEYLKARQQNEMQDFSDEGTAKDDSKGKKGDGVSENYEDDSEDSSQFEFDSGSESSSMDDSFNLENILSSEN